MTKKLLVKRPDIQKPSKNSQTAFRKAIDADHLKRADEILVHQHVIRRFRLHHRDDFNKLSQLRCALDQILEDDASLEGFLYYPQTKLLSCCMNFFESRENWEAFENGKHQFIFEKLRIELNEIFPLHFLAPYQENQTMLNLMEVLNRFSHDVTDIINRLNYFRYYSLFGMSSFIDGESLYEHYIKAKFGKYKRISLSAEAKPRKEALWMFTETSTHKPEFSAITETSCFRPKYTSKNINFFGGSQHSILVNDHPIEDRLILAIPTKEIPDRIDEALREFRRAWIQEYSRNIASIDDEQISSFDESIFMTLFSHTPCLLKDWDQLQRQIVGLWAWDTACLEKKSVPVACEQIENALEEIHAEFGEEKPYSFKSVKEDSYEKTAKEIGPRPPKKQLNPTRIDSFVTYPDTILGAIQDLDEKT